MATVWGANRLHPCRTRAARFCRLVSLAVLSCLALKPLTALALDPSRFLTQYGHTAWRSQDGELPPSAFPIAQTTDGYLWIGTRHGLVRFDGARFVPFEQIANRPIQDPWTVSLLGTSDGSLWIGSISALSRWHQGHLVIYPDTSTGAVDITEGPSGKLWFLKAVESDAPLCEVVETRVLCYGKGEGLEASKQCCAKLTKDYQDTFWITGRSDEIIRWRPGMHSTSITWDAKRKSGVPGWILMVPEPSGELWVSAPMTGPGLGLQRLVNDTLQPFVMPELDGSKIAPQALLRDSHGALWVGTIDHGIYRIFANRVDHFDSKDGLSSDEVRYFFEDRAGSVWVSTSKGIDRLRELAVPTFTTREGLTVDEVDSILAGHDGKIWIGTSLALDVLENGRVRPIDSAHGLPGTQVTSLLEDASGRLWVGTDNTLSIYANGKFKSVVGFKRRPMGLVESLVQDSTTDIWALIRRDPTRIIHIHDDRVLEELSEPALQSARSLAADPSGGLWFGLSGGELVHRNAAGSETFTVLPRGGAISHLIVASNGTVYGAAKMGLVALREGVARLITSKQGLPCDRVDGLVEDDHHVLWLQQACGLTAIADNELDRYFRDHDYAMHVDELGISDGVTPGVAPFNSATRAPDGTLWLADATNLQMVDPYRPRKPVIPPVYVEGLVADRKSYTAGSHVMLPPLTRDVQIDYTALELAAPQRVRFRYRLDGQDAEWTTVTGRRQAFYTDLPPGHYQFHVAASEGGDQWSNVPATLNFSIRPAFYQTGWFAALIFIATGALLWLVFSWRIAQVKTHMRARLEERLTERERIARELHDTFLQGVHGLMLKFHAVANLIPPDSAARNKLENALAQGRDVITEGRARVLDLRGADAPSRELATQWSSYGASFLQTSEATFNASVVGQPVPLNPVAADEVLNIGREAIGNAFMHAEARHIEIELTYGEKSLELRIRDDGKGMERETVEMGHGGHWGIVGMRERSRALGAKLNIWSRPGSGTEIELIVPAATAFAANEQVTKRSLVDRLRDFLGIKMTDGHGSEH
jgi:signal transduction histidine kinase/streptogramin lyase